MNIFLTLLQFLIFASSVFMILLILVQRGKGGGLTGALGGMGGQSAFGTKAGDVFTRITIITAVVWITLCMVTIAAFNPPRNVADRNDSRSGSLQGDAEEAGNGESSDADIDAGGEAGDAPDQSPVGEQAPDSQTPVSPEELEAEVSKLLSGSGDAKSDKDSSPADDGTELKPPITDSEPPKSNSEQPETGKPETPDEEGQESDGETAPKEENGDNSASGN